MTRGVVLVGQAPARRSRSARAFDAPGPSGERFPALAGLGRAEFFRRVEAVNLVRRWPGKSGKGDAFDLPRARRAAGRLARRSRPALFLLAGHNVAAAFGLRRLGYFERAAVGRHRALALPHPSGVNRWWNDAANAERARAFFAGLLERRQA